MTLLAANPVGKFSKAMNAAEREESEQAMARTFRAAVDFAVREHARMLVLDEVCAAITTGMLEEWDVLEFLDDKPEDLEVVLTGRNPTLRMQERADYISEICKRKHPFDRGIRAREGIEK